MIRVTCPQCERNVTTEPRWRCPVCDRPSDAERVAAAVAERDELRRENARLRAQLEALRAGVYAVLDRAG